MAREQSIRISVRDLVEFILRSGDIDNRRGAGMMDREAMQEGSRIHRKIQGRMDGNYRAEVPLAVEIPGEGYTLKVEGRADGIFREDGAVSPKMQEIVWLDGDPGQQGQKSSGTIGQMTLLLGENGEIIVASDVEGAGQSAGKCSDEKLDTPEVCEPEKSKKAEPEFYIDEIKGMYRDVMTLEEPYSLHMAQAKCYAYIYGSQNMQRSMGVQLTYCCFETEDVRRFRCCYTLDELGVWFGALVSEYQKWAEYQIAWKKIRQASIKGLQFPFPWREGQKEVASDVYRTILRRKKLFIQAPTGTGKTLSTVFPAVKAVGEGLAEQVFYATAKTITRTVAEEAFAILREKGLRMKVLTLTAKEKICFTGETECNPDACPYAKGHYDRVNDAVFELITTEEAVDRQTIERQAEKWQVCPFEFGLDVSLWSDAVICDYNYLFDPRAKLKRFFGEGVRGAYLFLIDEAHNLVERGREMFSASLYKEDFMQLKREIQPHSRKMARALGRCNSFFLEKKRDTEEVKVWPDAGLLPLHLTNLCGIMETFLEDSRNIAVNEKVLELYFSVRRFLDTNDRLSEDYIVYTQLQEDGRFLMRLYCVDIAKNLQECLEKGRSTIFFSATFLPIQYYKSLLTVAPDDYAIYAHSMFDERKRLVMIGTDTSSRYTNRSEREYRKIAHYVLRMIQARRGNYMVFFSSYRMMEDTAAQFLTLCEELNENITLCCQESGMSEEAREAFLSQFEKPHEEGFAGFCVMGGVFGEGIDLKYDRLIGAVIVGAGLPQVCSERELLKAFYDKRGQDGFFYAYLCPGMNKVLQSAGRVIRTEEDTGMILLLDDRFATRRYREMFPAEWTNLQYCTLNTVYDYADAFWKSRPEG